MGYKVSSCLGVNMSRSDELVDFYVTIFSHQSQEKYPENTLSKFSAILPKPINLNPEEKWLVGVTDLFHSPILGTTRTFLEEDIIIFPHYISVNSFELINFSQLTMQAAKTPTMYSREYFAPFLDIENLKTFQTNMLLQNYKPEFIETDETLTFTLLPFSIQWSARSSENCTEIVHEYKRRYKLNEVLWIYIDGIIKILSKCGDNETDLAKMHKRADETNAQYLLKMVEAFVSTMLFEKEKWLKQVGHKNATDSYNLLVYCDFVEGRRVGNHISQVLHFTARKAIESFREPVLNSRTHNICYVKLSKSFIHEMSFLIVDEQGSQIAFLPGVKPTVLNLHFKRA